MVLKLLMPSWMLFHSESLKFIYAVTNWGTSDLSLWWRLSSNQILCWWSSVTWSVSSSTAVTLCVCVCSGGPVWSGPQVWNVLAAATGTLQMRTRINWWKLHPPPSCWPKWWRTPSGTCTRYAELVKSQNTDELTDGKPLTHLPETHPKDLHILLLMLNLLAHYFFP